MSRVWGEAMEPSELVFKLSCDDSNWDGLDYSGSPPLSVFFPEGAVSEQLNYGQGEGQVLIDGHEWGFYYNDRRNLDVVLHDGGLSIEDASNVVSRICTKLRQQLGQDVRFALMPPAPAEPPEGGALRGTLEE
ncbi:hypothetical protein D7X74_15640 [Corallococcus sp. CA047B]|uniref:hypothetical protein n=1 Tax=Corallococcus sp. CA047B TaxID=2316729 RepID=UPI000EA1779C|nr:hypothetical protein [Corallococcus sp. CA047B]RKH16396.1 hypothetical protein D7X74_15640 [Corallococcus sp. CA047B]